MPKCILCEKDAKFKIKDTSDYYCKDCGLDQFGDIKLLVKVETQAKKLKKYLDEVGKNDIVD